MFLLEALFGKIRHNFAPLYLRTVLTSLAIHLYILHSASLRRFYIGINIPIHFQPSKIVANPSI